MLATQYADFYGVAPQQDDESDYLFRHRVAGTLRNMGKLIEAHEVQQDARIEDSEDVLTGVIGAVALALQGIDYGVGGEQQVGCDIAAGHLVKSPQPKLSPEAALLAVLLADKR